LVGDESCPDSEPPRRVGATHPQIPTREDPRRIAPGIIPNSSSCSDSLLRKVWDTESNKLDLNKVSEQRSAYTKLDQRGCSLLHDESCLKWSIGDYCWREKEEAGSCWTNLFSVALLPMFLLQFTWLMRENWIFISALY